jgi:hypothetical protein
VLLLSSFVCASSDDKPYDRKDIEGKLKQILVGKVAVLQKFYVNNDLHFDPQGNLAGDAKTGPWTSSGRVEIKNVKLSDTTLLLEGNRNVMRWEGTELGNHTLDNDDVRIVIDLPPNPTGRIISALLSRIFLFRALRMSDVVPDYWKDFLATERSRAAERQKYQAVMMKDIKTVDNNIKPPRLLTKDRTVEIAVQPFHDVDDDTVTFQFIVDATGGVKDLQITKPVGEGADDPIAEEIEQWKFEPAMSDNSPVGVVMYAKHVVKFARKQQPGVRMQLCTPDMQTTSQCQ